MVQYTVDWDIKYFGCKMFALSNFHPRTYVGYRSIYVLAMHTIFHVFNFRRRWKFNGDNLPIYSIHDVLLALQMFR